MNQSSMHTNYMKQNFPFLNDVGDSLNMSSVQRQKLMPDTMHNSPGQKVGGKVQTAIPMLSENNSLSRIIPKNSGFDRYRGKGDEILVKSQLEMGHKSYQNVSPKIQ